MTTLEITRATVADFAKYIENDGTFQYAKEIICAPVKKTHRLLKLLGRYPGKEPRHIETPEVSVGFWTYEDGIVDSFSVEGLVSFSDKFESSDTVDLLTRTADRIAYDNNVYFSIGHGVRYTGTKSGFVSLDLLKDKIRGVTLAQRELQMFYKKQKNNFIHGGKGK